MPSENKDLNLFYKLLVCMIKKTQNRNKIKAIIDNLLDKPSVWESFCIEPLKIKN